MYDFNGRSARLGAGVIVIGILFLVSGFSLAAWAAPVTRVELCHSGHDGSGDPHTIEVAPAAVPAHLASGVDYIGPCVGGTEGSTPTSESPTSTAEDSTTSTVDESTTTTQGSTTTTQGSTTTSEEPTTTTEDSTTTTVDVEATTVTTEPTDPSTSTSSGQTVIAPTGGQQGPSTTIGAIVVEAGAQTAEELPYTGVNMYLVVPGMLLVLAGAFAVFVANGPRPAAAGHIAFDSGRLTLGLHRGRHEV
jgi:hypothetical protein